MKGDIAFVGFMLTADEWQELDPESRSQLIAVATRRSDPELVPPRRFPEGTGKHEIVESIDDELDSLLELDLLDSDLLEPLDAADAADAAIEAEIARVDRDGDIALFSDDAITFDMTAQYDAIEQWFAFQPQYETVDLDEWVTLPAPVCVPAQPAPVCTTAAPVCTTAEPMCTTAEPVCTTAEPVVIPATAEPFEDFADWADL